MSHHEDHMAPDELVLVGGCGGIAVIHRHELPAYFSGVGVVGKVCAVLLVLQLFALAIS